ncbi:MAG: hypothetical protein M3Q07_05530 [Pseudobdellovibrionaceae bacterium]|nr:hypothetical protein [Pseudobdellovibrionaceae bacterium]
MCACNPNIRTPWCSNCIFHATATGSSIRDSRQREKAELEKLAFQDVRQREKAELEKFAREVEILQGFQGLTATDEAAELRNEISNLKLQLEIRELREIRDSLLKQLNSKGLNYGNQ